jgi:O-antigen ligase
MNHYRLFTIALISLSLIILFPLFNVVPSPSSNPSHPWFAEWIAISIVTAILFIRFYKRVEINLLPTAAGFLLVWLPFFLYSLLSVTWAKSRFSVFHFAAVWFIYLYAFMIFCHLISEGRQILVVFSIALIALILGLTSLIDLATNQNLEGGELGAFRIRYAKFAEILAVVSIFLLCLSLQVRKKLKLLISGAGLIALLGVLSSLSRGAFLSFLVGFTISSLGVLFFGQSGYRRKILLLIVAVLSLIIFSQISNFLPLSTSKYVVGEVPKSSDTTVSRIFFWKISLQMIRQHPIFGVGADNFWISFNDARREFIKNHPDDELLAIGEDFFVQRAHNELLQVFTELGLIGGCLFLLPFFYLLKVGYQSLRINKKLPSATWGAVGGILAFIVSSMFSSFSFRYLASGIMFFFLSSFFLMKADKEIRKIKYQRFSNMILIDSRVSLILFLLGIILTATTTMANLGNFLLIAGERKSSSLEAEPILLKAATLNPTNPTAYFSLALKYYSEKNFERAAELLRQAIDNGFDVSISWFYLASCYRAMGDLEKEERVLREGLSIFPRSIFLRVRLYLNLSSRSELQMADEELRKAMQLDRSQAIGWLKLMTLGASEAGRQALRDKAFLPPAALKPDLAVYVVIHEQELLSMFPRM